MARLNKRNIPKNQAPTVIDVIDEETSPATFLMEVAPDPLIRGKLPEEKIERVCSCGTVFALHVDNPENYNETTLKQLFKARGSQYDPPKCHWCVGRPEGFWAKTGGGGEPLSQSCA